MKIKEFIKGFVETSENKIISLVSYKITGVEKKARLDECLTEYVNKFIDSIGLNFAFRWILKKILIDNIPVITQCIFDLLKSKINGVTEVWTEDKANND